MRLLISHYITCEHTVIHKHTHPCTHAHTHTSTYTRIQRRTQTSSDAENKLHIWLNIYDTPYSYVWHDVFICVTWLFLVCGFSFTCVTQVSRGAHSLRHILRLHTSNRCCWNQPEIARVMSLREVHNCMSKSLGLIILFCIRISKRFWFDRNEARIGYGMIAFVAHLKSTHKCMGFVTHFEWMGHVTRMHGVCVCTFLCVFVSVSLCTRICVCACVACMCVYKQHCLSWTISG